MWPAGVGLAALGLASFASSQTAFADAPATITAPAPATVLAADAYTRPTTTKGLPTLVTLYQYEVCPYCCKVKAVLDYYKVPYRVVEVNPLTKGEIKWSTYKKVPILKMEDEVLTESTAIMSRLAAEAAAAAAGLASAQASALAASAGSSAASGGGGSTSGGSGGGSSRLVADVAAPKSWFSWGRKASAPAASSTTPAEAGMPASFLQPVASSRTAPAPSTASAEELKWRKWVDDRFVKVITANIYRSWEESFESFKYITKHTNWSWGTREAARVSGAVIMWQVGKKLPAKYGIVGDLRQALYDDCNVFTDSLGSRPFHGGERPDLADLATFGVLRAVEGTPTFADAMAQSRIAPWYSRVAALCPSARVAAE